MTQEALKLALEALNKLTDVFLDTEGNHGDYEQQAINQGNKAITAIKEALAQPEQKPVTYGLLYPQADYLAQPEQEPVAWRTFDGEGGYDYRSYEDNESYADDWDKRNPNHKGWVDKLYTHSQRTEQVCCQKYDTCLEPCTPRGEHLAQRTWVGLTDEEIEYVWRRVETSDFHDCVQPFAQAIGNILKEKNFV